MLINFSNHPSEYWGKKQLEAARGYGEIKEIPFPAVDPNASYDDIQAMTEYYVKEILAIAKNQHVTVHIMGEMTFTYLVVNQLKELGIECIASTSVRDAEVTSDGRKISDFQFVKFRRY